LHLQARSGYFDRDVHPPDIHWSTEFVFIGIIPSQDSSDEHPEIRASAYGKSAKDSRLILMVATNRDQSRNNSSGYPTIERSEMSDAQTPSAGLVQNLNLDFNVVWVQAIMETIQRMTSDGFSLAPLAQQGAETTNLVLAEKSASEPRRDLLAIMIGQDVPEVKSRPQLVQIGI
jgi:hypothetical protein